MTFFSVDLRTVQGVVRIPVGAYKSIAEIGRGLVVLWEAPLITVHLSAATDTQI